MGCGRWLEIDSAAKRMPQGLKPAVYYVAFVAPFGKLRAGFEAVPFYKA